MRAARTVKSTAASCAIQSIVIARGARAAAEPTRGEFWPLWSQIRQIPSKLDDNAAETGNIMQLSSNYTTAEKRESNIHPPIKLSLLLDNLLAVTPPREPTPKLHICCVGCSVRAALITIHTCFTWSF